MVVAALLLRNEAGEDRYLRRALENCKSLCDDIVVVDDGSTDDTAKVCREYGATVSQITENSAWWGKDETTPRSHLWTLACKAAGPDGWVYVADGDHELLGLTREDLRVLCAAEQVVGWATVLWDLWEPTGTMQRTDGWWQAWRSPRPWIVKAFPYLGFVPEWKNERGIHAGHLPTNWDGPIGVLPPHIGIAHWGYSQPAHRLIKHRKYVNLVEDGDTSSPAVGSPPAT